MPDLHEDLLSIEHQLAGATADAYRRHLADDAVVIVPGAVLDRDGCIAAIDASPGWDAFEITGARTLPVGSDGAVLTYHWHARRADDVYQATMSSVYTRRDGAWRLLLHQQTPDHR
jgi:hypothetical protein